MALVTAQFRRNALEPPSPILLTSGGAEGDIFEELLTNLQKDKFDVKECVMDHDSSCANVLLEKFPEAEVVYCGNHTVKTFHSELENVKKTPCQVKSVQRRLLYLIC